MSSNLHIPDKDLLEEICQLYKISAIDLKLLTARDNSFVYEFQRDGRNYILRGGTRNPIDLIRAELDWILFMHSFGVPVSIPIQSKNGEYLESISKSGETIAVVVFEKAPGKMVDIHNPEEWNEELWKTMGSVLGRIHAVSVKYNEKLLKFRRRSYYEDEFANAEEFLDPVEDTIIISRFDELKKKLEQLPREKDAYGLIHYDFHIENFNVDRGNISVFDWDDSHYFFFLYDLAASFHETIWDNPLDKRQEFADKFIPPFWRGYSEEFQLDRKWLEFLPDFFKWRDFTIYVIVVRLYNEEKTSDDEKRNLSPIITEFRDRIVSDTQIADIPKDLTIWFPEQ